MRNRSAVIVAALTFAAAGAGGADKEVWPMPKWQRVSPAKAGMDETLLVKAQKYAQSGGGSGYIVRGGRLVHAWGDPRRRYDLKSTTKSFGSLALGLAIGDGKVRLEDLASKHHPAFGRPPEENVRSGFIGKITLFHLATQTAGFEKPGGYGKILFAPGTKWHYSDAGPNWLAECLTLRYRTDLQKWMFERVFTPIGIARDDLRWRSHAYRPRKIDGITRREFGSGIHANVDALARVGLLCLRRGRWQDRQIVPAEYIDLATRTPKEIAGLPVLGAEAGTSNHYGLLWWNNNDGALKKVPRDAYWSWGLHDSFILVIPSLDVVVSRAGGDFKGGWDVKYDRLVPFFEPIALSVKDRAGGAEAPPAKATRAPYPPSPVIRGVTWAPKETIVRRAPGSDNWPMTWADDGHLYTAYGDGWGFKPKVKGKLSLGLCRVEGPAGSFRGFNVRSVSGEQKGDGARGRKASGMLSVNGRLHMFVRNAGNAQLAWSDDHGRTWTWADWKFTTSFGCPTFLNFGRDYAGARDDFVYIYSFDSDSAYTPSDRMVLARVPKDRVTERDAYVFFVKLDGQGQPAWSRDIRDRGAVFVHRGKRCYRSGVTYNAGLKRYLWCQTIPGGDTRFKGGFGIYDAPEPWGPWSTVYYTRQWDVGPGESSSIPTKWMSADGRTVHMVFSGDDHFSVRRATLEATDR